MSKRLGGIISCKFKTLRFPDGSNIGSTVSCCVQMCVFMAVLIGVVTAEVYNVPVPMTLLHVSLLLDFTAAAAAGDLRSRRQQHANSAAAAGAALQARRKERTRLAGVYDGGYRN